MYVFVYGTLKQGEPNHNWLQSRDNGESTFVGNGKLVKKYPLVIASKYNIPFLLDRVGVGKEVQGEVYEIDEKMLGNLDKLEEYPKLYTRREEAVEVEQTGNERQIIHAWTYILSQFRPEILDLPHLDSYSASGPHNLRYVPRYLRDINILATDFINVPYDST